MSRRGFPEAAEALTPARPPTARPHLLWGRAVALAPRDEAAQQASGGAAPRSVRGDARHGVRSAFFAQPWPRPDDARGRSDMTSPTVPASPLAPLGPNASIPDDAQRRTGARRRAAPVHKQQAARTIGSYELERKLGGGGMAEVFLARKRGLWGFSRPVAIKRVLPSFASHPRAASLFVAEARVSARLAHPNIVSVLDFKHDRAHGLYLVMELVEGPDLAQLLRTGALPLPCCIFIAVEVLRGLGYAHHLPLGDARGVIHRDMSPQNVLLSWQGAVKVSDFGIAKLRASSNASASAVVKGKPAYMSPEQASGRPLDGRADLFSVGVVLWEMLVGRPLFAGATVQETLSALLFSPIASPRALRPEVPRELAQVALGLLQRDPSRRYATAEQAIAALLACAAAPRDGQAALISVLRTRFAAEAPAAPPELSDGVVRAAMAVAPTAQLESAPGAPSMALRPAPPPPVSRALAGDASSAVTLVQRRRPPRRLWRLALAACGVAYLVASPGRASSPSAAAPARAHAPASAGGERWSPLTGHFAWRSLLGEVLRAAAQPAAPKAPPKGGGKGKRTPGGKRRPPLARSTCSPSEPRGAR